MELIEQRHYILSLPTEEDLMQIEHAGRVCYQSGGPVDPDEFIKKLISKGHESVIEHAKATVGIITSRGVTHELVRHRLASYSQESTRYVRYDNIQFIRPVWWASLTSGQQLTYMRAFEEAESAYRRLLDQGQRAEQAREVLPNATKTEIIVTANVREWRHIFKLRTHKTAHPQIRELMTLILQDFKEKVPTLFGDL